MALSASVYITVFVGLMGVMHALIPILAQQFGAGRNARRRGDVGPGRVAGPRPVGRWAAG